MDTPTPSLATLPPPPPPPGTPPGEAYFDEERRILVFPGKPKSARNAINHAGSIFFGLVLVIIGISATFGAESWTGKSVGIVAGFIGLMMLVTGSNDPGKTEVIVLDELPEKHRKVWEEEAERLRTLQRQRQGAPPPLPPKE
ncbi:MAG: hypothetical protein AB1705_22615 [Verrucomicrobiota bacterium]